MQDDMIHRIDLWLSLHDGSPDTSGGIIPIGLLRQIRAALDQQRATKKEIAKLQKQVRRFERSEKAAFKRDEKGKNGIEGAILAWWGERCSDFEPECGVCQVWAQYDELVKAAATPPEPAAQEDRT